MPEKNKKYVAVSDNTKVIQPQKYNPIALSPQLKKKIEEEKLNINKGTIKEVSRKSIENANKKDKVLESIGWQDKAGKPAGLQGLYNTVGKSALTALSLRYGRIPTTQISRIFTPSGLASTASNIYLGNELSNAASDILEGGVSVAGQIAKPWLNEQSKKIGGVNDIKQSYKEFSNGKIKNGLFNLATGLGGIYDSNWIPGRYDDIVDKGLELLNLTGDTNDAYKAYKQIKRK